MTTATRTMALAVDYTDGRVRYLPDETAEPWADVLERAGEDVEDSATVGVRKVESDVFAGADVYEVTVEHMQPGYTVPIKSTEHYLVGSLRGPSEPDPDEQRDREYDL